jgi:hypothetical protein
VPRQAKTSNENGNGEVKKVKKSSSKADTTVEGTAKSSLVRRDSTKSTSSQVEVRRTATSSLVRRDSGKSTSSQVEVRRTASSKSIPPPQRGASAVPSQQGREGSVASEGNGFLAKVTCWQQRADPEQEATLRKRGKPRPVSIAGDGESAMLKPGGLKRTPSMGSLTIPENVRPGPL